MSQEVVAREAVSGGPPDGTAAGGDWLASNTIRTLTIDAVQAAQSGHPGAAMALAPVGYTLWNNALRYDVHDPGWLNRDRFVLSAGHASMLLYSLLHLAQVRRNEVQSAGLSTQAGAMISRLAGPARRTPWAAAR